MRAGRAVSLRRKVAILARGSTKHRAHENGDGNVHCQREQAGIEGDAGGTEMKCVQGLKSFSHASQLPPKKPAAHPRSKPSERNQP